MRPSKFIFYTEWLRTMDAAELSKNERSRLIDAIVAYADTGIAQELPRLLMAIFSPIKATLDRDFEKYERKAAVNRANGANGGRPRKPTETHQNPVGFIENPPKPTKTQSRNNININIHKDILTAESSSAPEDEKGIIYEIFFWRNFADPNGELARFYDYNGKRKWKAMDTPTKRTMAAGEWQPVDGRPRVRKEFLDMWHALYSRVKNETPDIASFFIDCGARFEFHGNEAKLRSRSKALRQYIELVKPPEIMQYIGNLKLTTASP